MKKFMSLALATGLILAGVGVVFAADAIHNTSSGMSKEWVNIAASQSSTYFFDETVGTGGSSTVAVKAYPVLGSSGVFVYYDSDNPNFYVMGALSNRGDKCYGTSQSSTIIAMFDMKTTGHEKCEGATMPDVKEITEWDGGTWTKTDGSPLPATMTAGSQT